MGYLGNKSADGVFQAIIAAMPPHDTYIEPFLGSGIIMKLKPPAARSIGLDLSPAAIAAFDDGVDRAGAIVSVGDARSYLIGFDYAAAGRVFIYADPPYLPSTRARIGAKRYKHDMTEQDHIGLVALLKKLPAAVMLSGYPSALYDALLPDWRTVEFQSMTRGGVRTEKLWMNYPPSAVHWATFAGKDFHARQSIKRKAARWAAKFKACPPGERTAILAALLETATAGSCIAGSDDGGHPRQP